MNKFNETIHVYVLCYNEILLLPYFVQHYRNTIGADKITVFDNDSTDGSAEKAIELGCDVFKYDSKGQIRDDYYTYLKNQFWKGCEEDWAIVCDMDEFLFVPYDYSGHISVPRVQGYDVLGLPISTFGRENKMYGKQVMFRPHCFKEMNYNWGGHTCSPVVKPEYIRNLHKTLAEAGDAKLLHHCYISEEYVIKRYAELRDRLSDFNKNLGLGKQYEQSEAAIRYNFEILRSQGSVVLV